MRVFALSKLGPTCALVRSAVFSVFVVTLTALAFIKPVSAATITITETVDAFAWATTGVSLSQNYVISEGDTVVMDFTFANGEYLLLTKQAGPCGCDLSFLLAAPGVNATTRNNSVTLKNFSTDSSVTMPLTRTESGYGLAIGTGFGDPDVDIPEGQFLKFSGFVATFNVFDFAERGGSGIDTQVTVSETKPRIQLFTIAVVVPIPLPAGLPLLAGGLGLLGLLGWRRKRGTAVGANSVDTLPILKTK